MRTAPTGLLVGAVYAMAAVLAVGIGVWAGSAASSPHLRDDRPHFTSVGHDTQARVPNVNDVLAGVRLPADYTPIGLIEVDDNCFAVLVEHMGVVETKGAILGGGSAEIFDHEGRLLRRYIALEGANSSWELMEYVRLPAHRVRQAPECR